MRVYRLTRAPYATLDGKGALVRSGRWHTKGNPVVYASSSRALALLECLVNFTSYQLPEDLVFLAVDVPDRLIASLNPPTGWNSPESDQARQAGDAWLGKASSAALAVPSVVVPKEANILLNPVHPGFAEIRVAGIDTFQPDPRLKLQTSS